MAAKIKLSKKEFKEFHTRIKNKLEERYPEAKNAKLIPYEKLEEELAQLIADANFVYNYKYLYNKNLEVEKKSAQNEFSIDKSYLELLLKFIDLNLDNYKEALNTSLQKESQTSFIVYYIKPFEVLKGTPQLYSFTLDIQSLEEVFVRKTITGTQYKGRVKKEGSLVKTLDLGACDESRTMHLVMQKGNYKFEKLKLALGFGSFEFIESYYGTVRCILIQESMFLNLSEEEQKNLEMDFSGYLTLVSLNPVRIGSNTVYDIRAFRDELKNVKNNKSLIRLTNNLMYTVSDLLTYGADEKSIKINEHGLYNRINKQTRALKSWIKTNEDCMKKKANVMRV